MHAHQYTTKACRTHSVCVLAQCCIVHVTIISMFAFSIEPPANQMTLQELIKRYNLTDEQLNSEIEDPDTPKLALCFDNVELYSSSMRLPPAEQADVNMLYHREGTQTAMMKCLKIWKQHNPYQATYRALLDIVLGLDKGEQLIKSVSN